MSYVDENLAPGERVVYRTFMHWTFFLPTAVVTAVVGLFLLTLWLPVRDEPEALPAVGMFGLFFFFLLAIAFLYRFLLWKTYELAVTTQRLIVKTGIVRRSTQELLLSKIETVSVSQPLLGRLLGYGDVTVTGTEARRRGSGTSPTRSV